MKFDENLKPLNLSYDPLSALKLANTGQSFKISFDDEAQNTLSGGPLVGRYHLAQIHGHWSSRDSEGSEHTVNGKAYPSEVSSLEQGFILMLINSLRSTLYTITKKSMVV